MHHLTLVGAVVRLKFICDMWAVETAFFLNHPYSNWRDTETRGYASQGLLIQFKQS